MIYMIFGCPFHVGVPTPTHNREGWQHLYQRYFGSNFDQLEEVEEEVELSSFICRHGPDLLHNILYYEHHETLHKYVNRYFIILFILLRLFR